MTTGRAAVGTAKRWRAHRMAAAVSATMLAVGWGAPPASAQITGLSGVWSYSETINVHCVVEGEDLGTDQLSGSGDISVQQDGNMIRWTAPSLDIERTGVLNGNVVTVSGPFAIPLSGPFDVTFSTNTFSGAGTVNANADQIPLSGTGVAAGTVCASGIGCGAFSCTGTSQALLRRPLVTVQRTGTCGGMVTSSPPGIACGDDCANGFSKGGPVTLAAQPNPGAAFGGWSGACAGTGPCTLFPAASANVQAQFLCAPLVAAVLPSSRSVQTGTAATAFATVINAGATALTGCTIARTTAVPTTFTYQATDPATNQPVGAPNTPVGIPAGQAKTFVVSLTPSAAFAPVDVRFAFACPTVAPAPVFVGLNTLLLTASAAPVPDIVALAATSSGDGTVMVDRPLPSIDQTVRAGAFAVATVNLGAEGTISVSADSNGAPIAVSTAVCQTGSDGACIGPALSEISVHIAAGAQPTFAVFVVAVGTVPSDPAANRIFVRFKQDGVSRGATSVAVRTP